MDTENLQRLIGLVTKLMADADARLGDRPDWLMHRGGYHAYDRRRDAEMEAIKAHLTEHEGARFVRGQHSLESLLLATATIIMMFAKGDPNDLAESYADELVDRVRVKAPGFPETLKVGRLQ